MHDDLQHHPYSGPFVGNGVTTVFPFTFKVFAKGDIVATFTVVATGVESTLVLTTDYAVYLNAPERSSLLYLRAYEQTIIADNRVIAALSPPCRQVNLMNIAILDDYLHLSQKSADWSKLPPDCEITVFDRPLAVPEEAARVLQPFHVLCHIRERTPMPRALIERLPNLKLIAITGFYHRTLDVAAATERGIVVSHSGRGAHSKATSELAWGLMLSVARHIPFESNEMRKGGWQHTAGITLAGRTLGLLGLGRQGRYMVPVAKAFDMEVIAWSQNLTAEVAAQFGARRVEKDELFRSSDVLSVHLVLGERTRGIVGARELSLMKPTAILVNTARGPIVDEAALVATLREGRIAGAGLDVYGQEPLPDAHPLRTLPNVVLTPHLGYATQEFFQAAYAATIENIAAFAAGKPIRVLTADRNDSTLVR